MSQDAADGDGDVAAFNLVSLQMSRLADVTPVAGVPDAGNIDRATDVAGPDGATISLEPPGAEQLRDLLGTAETIASATDARYGSWRAARWT